MRSDTTYPGVVAYQPETGTETEQLRALKALLTSLDGPHMAYWSYDGADYPDLNADASEAVLLVSTPHEQPSTVLDDPGVAFGLGVVAGGVGLALLE